MKVTVDRFEEGFAVCIDDGGKSYNIQRDKFPFEVHPCDILDIVTDGKTLVSASLLTEETEKEKKRVKSIMERLRKKFRK